MAGVGPGDLWGCFQPQPCCDSMTPGAHRRESGSVQEAALPREPRQSCWEAGHGLSASGLRPGTAPGTGARLLHPGCSIPSRRSPVTTRSSPRPGPAAAPRSPPRSRGAGRGGAARAGIRCRRRAGGERRSGAERSAEGSAVSRSAGEPRPRPLWRSIKVRRRRACPCPLLLVGSGVGEEGSQVGHLDRRAREWKTPVGMENHEWGRAVRAASRTRFAARKALPGSVCCSLPAASPCSDARARHGEGLRAALGKVPRFGSPAPMGALGHFGRCCS